MDKSELRELLRKEMSSHIEESINAHASVDQLLNILRVNGDIKNLNHRFNNNYQKVLEKGERFSDVILEEMKQHLEQRGYVYSGCEENSGHTFRKKMCCYKGI